jgi:hypothetical protein
VEQAHTYVIPAEGNPDEEKIGAFGVGECSSCLLVALIFNFS